MANATHAMRAAEQPTELVRVPVDELVARTVGSVKQLVFGVGVEGSDWAD